MYVCYEFSLRFANVTSAAISTGNVVNGITSIFFIIIIIIIRRRRRRRIKFLYNAIYCNRSIALYNFQNRKTKWIKKILVIPFTTFPVLIAARVTLAKRRENL